MKTFALILSLVWVASAGAVPLTIQECKDYGDALLDRLDNPGFHNRQTVYKNKNGRFWQGISPLSGKPTDGVELPSDDTKKPPGAKKESWKKFGTSLDAEMPVDVQVNEYESSGGNGYFIRVSFMYGISEWVKSDNYGPGVGFDHDWKEYVRDPPEHF